MRHYQKAEWKLYIQDEVESEKKEKMEKHLYDCDQCLDLYLSEIEKIDEKGFKEWISPQFTEVVMDRIVLENIQLPKKNAKKGFTNVFICYVVAASITLLLMYNGVFDFIGYTIPQATNQFIDSTKITGEFFTNNYSERFLNDTFKLFNTLNFKDEE